jgi:hypothetical protein
MVTTIWNEDSIGIPQTSPYLKVGMSGKKVEWGAIPPHGEGSAAGQELWSEEEPRLYSEVSYCWRRDSTEGACVQHRRAPSLTTAAGGTEPLSMPVKAQIFLRGTEKRDYRHRARTGDVYTREVAHRYVCHPHMQVPQ